MKNSVFCSLVALAMCIAQPAIAEDVSIDTYRGEAVVSKSPNKIVALDVSTIDILDALGVEIAGIPSPLYVDYLNDLAGSAQSVGSLFEPNFEALANMSPDLIVAGGRSSKQFEPLSQIAPTIDMTIWGDDHLEQVLSRLNALGKLTGKDVKAGEITSVFNAKLDEAKSAVIGKGNALILMANGPKISTFGVASRFGWLHSALDLPEAIPSVDEQTHGDVISFEFVANANPDWLIVVDRGAAIGSAGETASETLNNALVKGTKAWKNGQVIYLNSANIYIAGGGIQSMSFTLDEIIAAFNKAS